MVLREGRASGIGCVQVATALLRRIRMADPDAGVWEAADVQWWWRRPRASDALEQPYRLDEDGPIGMGLLTEWGSAWQLDPIAVPEHAADVLPVAIERALALSADIGVRDLAIRAGDEDHVLGHVIAAAGFTPTTEIDRVAWMDASAFSAAAPLPSGYRLTDRRRSPSGPHWLEARNGPETESRLRECSLYDPELDLAVHTVDGDLASYALLWFDDVTSVGMIEPMRTEDDHQRRGLGRALLAAGLRRVVDRGASRLKVGFESEAAQGLYESLGFEPTQTTRIHRRRFE